MRVRYTAVPSSKGKELKTSTRYAGGTQQSPHQKGKKIRPALDTREVNSSPTSKGKENKASTRYA